MTLAKRAFSQLPFSTINLKNRHKENNKKDYHVAVWQPQEVLKPRQKRHLISADVV